MAKEDLHHLGLLRANCVDQRRRPILALLVHIGAILRGPRRNTISISTAASATWILVPRNHSAAAQPGQHGRPLTSSSSCTMSARPARDALIIAVKPSCAAAGDASDGDEQSQYVQNMRTRQSQCIARTKQHQASHLSRAVDPVGVAASCERGAHFCGRGHGVSKAASSGLGGRGPAAGPGTNRSTAGWQEDAAHRRYSQGHSCS